jgi:hypothetical protein
MKQVVQKKEISKWILFLLIVVVVSSCLPTYYMGNSGLDPIVFTKPVYRDSAMVTNYIGGKLTQSLDSTYNWSHETNFFGQAYWFRTHTQKYYSFSYGAFGYLGNFNVIEVPDYAGNKSYFGGGLSGDICWNIPLKVIDLKLVGLKGSFYYEDGDFRKFKILAEEQNLAVTTTDQFAYNVSLTSGVDVKLNKVSSIGLYFSNGMSALLVSKARFFYNTSILNYQTNRFTVYLQSSTNILNQIFLNRGMHGEISIGLNYRL